MTRTNANFSSLLIAIFIAFFALTFGIVNSAQAAGSDAVPNAPLIYVSGDASVSSVPDQAIINLGVVTNHKSLTTAQETNSSKTRQVITAIKAKGVSKDDIRTSNYNVWPRYDYAKENKSEPPAIIGYEVRNEITVKVKDISTIGKILDSALRSGANQVNNIYFDKAEKGDLENQALTQAVLNAQSKATAIASALGMQLGRVLSVNDSGAQIFMPENRNMMDSAKLNMVNNEYSVPISPGQIKITARVAITFEMF